MTNDDKIKQILSSPCTSYWLKNVLDSALNRDPVDAAFDAQTLADLLKSRMKQALTKRTYGDDTPDDPDNESTYQPDDNKP